MLVPRSFQYASRKSEQERGVLDEKGRWTTGRVQTRSPVRTMTEPARLQAATSTPTPTPSLPLPLPSKPVAVPTVQQPDRRYVVAAHTVSAGHGRTAGRSRRRQMPAGHDSGSLPPSVAALLAVTQIPRPKPHQFRRPRATGRHVSIDELVNAWKQDVAASPSYGSSPALNMLLEEQDETDLHSQSLPEGHGGHYLPTRSTSAESVPSLDNDDKSLLSFPSPPTPEHSLRSRRSVSNLKKDKPRSLSVVEDCGLDHPLEPSLCSDEPDESIMISPPDLTTSTSKSKGRFTSNLTLSLQALKNAAITKISSLSLSNASPPSQSQRTPSAPFSDDVLWSHPYLFPRFSPEVRPPTVKGTPSKAERRYLNPLPLTFEEQEAPFQQALHAPYLAEEIAEAPTIQMQTYHRGRRRGSSKRPRGGGSPDPNSEAGRAMAVGVKMREPRENGDFLRVVVLEMNMRRTGKLETGKAKMWLPPRPATVEEDGDTEDGVPRRWRGTSAY